MKNIGKYAMIAFLPLAAAVVSCDDEFEVVGENPPLEQMLKIECMENVEFDAYGGRSGRIIRISFIWDDFWGRDFECEIEAPDWLEFEYVLESRQLWGYLKADMNYDQEVRTAVVTLNMSYHRVVNDKDGNPVWNNSIESMERSFTVTQAGYPY